MNIDTLLVYLLVAFFYITSPGPAVILAIINGLRTNMKVVAISTFANTLGLAILSTASILGLGVLLTTSATLFMIVKFVGAFYLVYLGVKFIRNKNVLNIEDISSNKEIRSSKSYFLESFFLAVTNPKPILFFTAIFPQFLDVKAAILPQFLIMTFFFLCISFFSLYAYAYLAKKSKSYLSDKNRMNWFHKITGGIFISMGIGLLSLKNHN